MSLCAVSREKASKKGSEQWSDYKINKFNEANDPRASSSSLENT
jgi:hypothetical protein